MIQQYISIASQNSPELNAETKVYQSSRTRFHQAGAKMLPSLEFTSRYTRAGGGREFVFDLNPYGFPMVIRENFIREREHETKFTLIQPIFTGGGNYYSYKASRYQAESSKFYLKAFEQNLYLSVVKAYTDLLTASEMIESAESVVERAVENHRVASARVKAGSSVTADTLRSRAEQTLAKADLTVIENRWKIAEREFIRILGTNDVNIKFPDEIPRPEVVYLEQSTIESSISEGLNSRPEMDRIQASIRASSSAQNAVRGLFLPSIFVSADYGWEGVEYRLNSDYDFWMISGFLRWNLFNGFGDKARWNESKLRTRELVDRKAALQNGIEQEILAVATEFNNALTEWESSLESLTAAEENYRIRKLLYESGTGTMLELLDSNELLKKAAAGEIASRYRVIFLKYKLNWAKGADLWEERD